MEETQNKSDKEMISLDMTTKGLYYWNVKVKAEKISQEDIERLVEVDKQLRIKFQNNVLQQ
jgi:hypothetical protein